MCGLPQSMPAARCKTAIGYAYGLASRHESCCRSSSWMPKTTRLSMTRSVELPGGSISTRPKRSPSAAPRRRRAHSLRTIGCSERKTRLSTAFATTRARARASTRGTRRFGFTYTSVRRITSSLSISPAKGCTGEVIGRPAERRRSRRIWLRRFSTWRVGLRRRAKV